MQAHNSPAQAQWVDLGRRAVACRRACATLLGARALTIGFSLAVSTAAGGAVDPATLDRAGDIAYRRAIDPAVASRKLNANADVTARIRRIVNRIVAAAASIDVATRAYAWSINVVSDASPALVVYPGGRIVVHDSLAAVAGLVDDEMAAIAAHAIAHSMLGHDASRIVARAGAAVDSADPNKRALALADAAVELRNARYSADENAAADRLMIELMARGAFDPRAAGSGWRRIRDARLIAARSPVTDERLAAIDAAAREAVPLFDETRARAAAQAPSIRPPPGMPHRVSPR